MRAWPIGLLEIATALPATSTAENFRLRTYCGFRWRCFRTDELVALTAAHQGPLNLRRWAARRARLGPRNESETGARAPLAMAPAPGLQILVARNRAKLWANVVTVAQTAGTKTPARYMHGASPS
jgi:hypothetical protein